MKKALKILLVSKFSNNPEVYTYASSFYKALQKLGYDVETFNCKKNFLPIKSHQNHEELPEYLKRINNYFCNKALNK